MRLTINTQKLLENVLLSNLTIDSFNINPFLTGIYIKVENDVISLTSSNLNTSSYITIREGFKVEEEGSILIKGSTLLNLLQQIKDKEISINKVENNVVNITTSNGSYNLNLFNEESFPTLSFDNQTWLNFELENNLIKKISSTVSPCVVVTNDLTRVYNGISIKSNEEEIEITGTDGHHLANLKQKFKGPKFDIIISLETLNFLEKIIKGKKTKFYLNNQKMIIEVEDNLFLCKLIEGKFKSMDKALNVNYPNNFIINKKEFENIINISMILANNQKRPTINLEIKKNQININTINNECGSSSQKIKIIKTNISENYTINLNIKLLQHIVKAFNGDEIKINFINENKQLMITNDNDPELTFLIMPIRL